MSIHTKALSAAIASAFALAIVGCGASSVPSREGGILTPPDVSPPVTKVLPEPTVQMNFFEPKTEQELRSVYKDGEFKGMGMTNYGYMIAKTRLGFDQAAFAKHGLDVVGNMSANGANYWYLHREQDLVETMKKARKMDGVMYIEPDTMNYAMAGIEYSNPDTYVASQLQYGVLTTQTKKTWETHGFGPNRPVVVNIDTGVNWHHGDLAGVVKHAFSWYSASNGNALLTDIGALNPLNDPEPPDRLATDPAMPSGTDGHGHGTHTAGTMAAVGNNGRGVAGVCWNVDLVSYKGLSDSGGGGNWAIYGSLWHLAKWKNQKVTKTIDGKEVEAPRYPHTIPVNYSLGGAVPTHFQADMIEMALEHGIVPICASGNDSSGFASWPGGYTGAIRVGAVSQLDRRVFFSNWGPDMSVMAPGMMVLSTDRSGANYYGYQNGTSMAAPHVTGLVGYMLTFAPDLRADQIKTYLEKNADPVDGQNGFSNLTGWGRINTYRTISAVIADVEAGRAPASDYVFSPVKITVRDGGGRTLNGVNVWLYNCDQAGAITNYVAVCPTGDSFVDVRDNKVLAPEPGVARFNLLRPGYYKAVAQTELFDLDGQEMATYAQTSHIFEVRAGAAVPPIALGLDADTLFVQTCATSNAARQGGDTVIRVYGSLTGDALIDWDIGTYDTVPMIMPKKAGTYWIQVAAYGATVGEYALWLGRSTKPAPAPGTFADPGADGTKGGLTTSRAEDSPLIKIDDKVVYGDMTPGNRDTGDWYRFVVE
jgi:hypothetical protein